MNDRQEADRAEEIPGQKGRVEGQKGENDRVIREQRGSSRFGWGPIGGVSQNSGRRGEENDEGKRGVKKGKS